MKVLQVIDQAFRTTGEEQDDTILWLTQCMRGAGAELEVLLTGHGAYYTVQSRTQPALKFGDWQQTQPADITQDIGRLREKGVPVYVEREALQERGLFGLPVLPGVEVISRNAVVKLYENADQIWHW
jgi:sulfur relay (sulfurtransferase) DsrF/TusC family protein